MRFIAFIVGLLLICCASANAQVVVHVASSPAAQNPGFAGGNVTFTNMNGGTNFPANSKIVVAFIIGAAYGTITIGGNTMTLAEDATESGNGAALFYFDVGGSSVTDTLVIGGGGNGAWAAAGAWYLTGAASGAPSVTGNFTGAGATQTVTLNPVPTSGAMLVGAFTNFSAGFTPSWTNTTSGTGDWNTVGGTTAIQISGAHNVTSGSQTVTLNGVNGGTSLAAAAWGVPAVGGPPSRTLTGAGQ